jgi:Cu-Zn family superoxide dismutase
MNIAPELMWRRLECFARFSRVSTSPASTKGRRMRRIPARILSAALLSTVAVAACGGETADPNDVPGSAPPVSAPVGNQNAPTPDGSGPPTNAAGTFTVYSPGVTAITYDDKLVPPSATANLTMEGRADTTQVMLAVSGLPPRHGYGAHLHVNPCGPTGADAGPHYQHHVDPAAGPSRPSVDPSYANPGNEVWLDFTTDAAGTATVTATQPWTLDAADAPRSLVIHAQPTARAAGRAGEAGARVGCLTLSS